MDIIELCNVTKMYGGKVILDKLDMKFQRGQSVAFVGHNGCGKSTALKLIAKLAAPTSGKVLHAKRLLFHYVPERIQPTALTAGTYLKRMGAIDGLSARVAEERVRTLSRDFFMEELLDTPMRALSKGSLQKTIVIQALLCQPDVLLLDEPLSGQDTDSQRVFIKKIQELRSRGVTVFMSCHEQNLLDAIAGEAYTVAEGKLVACRREKRKPRYTLILEKGLHGEITAEMEKYGSYYRMQVDEENSTPVICGLLQNGWSLRGMYGEKISESDRI